jgi:putative sterol carrier protein
MAKATSAQEVFEFICTRFRPDKAPNAKASFAFNLSGEGGGQYWTVIENGVCSSGTGDSPTPPEITIIASAPDFLAFVNGELNPMAAITMGKLKIIGNMASALKMVTWFDLN